MTSRLPVTQIIGGRLLILQSKRLMLNATERRLAATGEDSLRKRVERLRVETADAQSLYKSTMLNWGGPSSPDYWPIAYGRLAEMGTALGVSLTAAIKRLPNDEQYEAAIEIEILERIVERWNQSKREAMAKSVA